MTIKFYLTRPKGKGETSIFARLSYSGFQLKYYTPEKINPKFWSKETHLAKQTDKFREYPEFNQRLTDWKRDASNIFRKWINDNDGTVPNPQTLREVFDRELSKKQEKGNQQITFLGFFESLIEQSEKGSRLNSKTGHPIAENTLKSYKTVLNHLTAFQHTRKKRILFNDIDLEFYNDYTQYLQRGQRLNRKTGKVEPISLSLNTIGNHIKIIKLVQSEATERGLNTNLQFQSKRFVKPREKTDSIYLNAEELKELYNLELPSEKLQRVRDLFLVGCYTGLRFGDGSKVRPEHIVNGYIHVTQLKTGNEVVIPVHSTVERILAKYNGNLPPAISNQKTNEYLKEIGKMMPCLHTIVSKSSTKGGIKVVQSVPKWELLATHSARRSFATNEYLAGTPTITIMAITGHRTEKSFMKYIKLTPTEHATVMKLSWEKRATLTAV